MPASWQLPVFPSRKPVHRKMRHQRHAGEGSASQSVRDLKVGGQAGHTCGADVRRSHTESAAAWLIAYVADGMGP